MKNLFSYLLFLLIPVTHCNLNLFLATHEVFKLLGLENELYYVRDGLVNKYAMGFVIPVPSSVASLQFTWWSTSIIQYTISASSSHPLALPNPSVNITRAGLIPNQPETWSLALECSGTEAAEVIVTLDISIRPSGSANSTSLTFRRKKACFLLSPRGGTDDSASTRLEHMIELQTGDRVPAYVVFFAGVGSCLVLLIMVLTAVIAAWMRSVKAPKVSDPANSTQYTPVPPGDYSGTIMQQNNTTELLLDQSTGSNVLKEGNPRLGGYVTSTLRQSVPVGRSGGDGMTSDTPSEWGIGVKHVTLEDLVIDRLDLTLGDLLLEGTFGRVYQGRLATRPHGDLVNRDVMVKTIVMGSSQAQALKLVTEGSLLLSVSHKHVVPLLATTNDGTSPMMIYEYMNPGNLKKWLSGCHQPVSTHQCVNMGLQLLTALKHLHKRHIIHKDVAARNCYLTSNLTVKLCDPALSKDLFPNDYHCLGDNENRPVRWMAMESISSSQFTSSSDVWAWGVTMWEILTRAQQPFPDVDPFEMETYLREGFRLHQPVNCPDQLYTVMVSCWAHSSNHRASVPSLYSHLLEFNTQLQQFV